MKNRLLRLTLLIAATACLSHAAQAQTSSPQSPGGSEPRGLPLSRPAIEGLPTWPQRFDLADRTPASFGFVVTQPGPIHIDVQAQGAPLLVAVNGPHPLQQMGSGRIQLDYVVTAQDIQRSPYWSVRMTLQNPPAAAAQPLAGGTVAVQSPPADTAGLQARFNAEAPQRRAAMDNGRSRLNAQLDGMLQQSRMQMTKAQDDMRASAELRLRPTLEPMRMQSKVSTRGLGMDRPDKTALSTEAGARIRMPIATPPPAAPPHVGGTDVSQGLPRQLMLVRGSGFGTQGGAVLFTVNPGIEQAGSVEAWSDTLIGVRVPDAAGIGPFNGALAVVRTPDNQRSNAVSFGFMPEMEVRQIRDTRDAVIGLPGQNGDHHVFHGWNSFWDAFAGQKNDDVLMPTSRLQNGWMTEWSRIYPQTSQGNSGDAYATDSRAGTDMPYIRVHWWHDAWTELNYQYTVQIRGPRGMPDGVACTKPAPTPVPCQ